MGADEPYRVLVQRMNEGVLTFGSGWTTSCLPMTGCPSSQAIPPEDLIDRHVATLFAGEAPALVPNASLEASLLRHDDFRLPVKVWTRSISIGEKVCDVGHLNRSFNLPPSRATCHG